MKEDEMTWTGCEETAWWLTWALKQEGIRERLAVTAGEGAPLDAIVLELAEHASPEIAARMNEELHELPAAALVGILAAWREADGGGKPFELKSVRPQAPVAMARRRSVRLTIDVHDEGVQAELSHIPTRHPEWARH
jgi:hypothetical protein